MKKINKLFFLLTLMLVGFIGINGVKADSTVLYNDGTLIINEKDSDRESNTSKHGAVLDTYAAFNGSNYVFSYSQGSSSHVLWEGKLSKIKRVEIGQVIRPTTTAYWFYDMKYLQTADLSNLDTSDVTNMSHMFENAGAYSQSFVIDVSGFTTSSVTDMSYLFAYSGNGALDNPNYNYVESVWSIGDLSNWDVSNVTNMKAMFMNSGIYSTNWNVGDLSSWDTVKVTDMGHLFDSVAKYSENINIAGISEWTVSHVTDMTSMLAGISPSSLNLDLSNWDISNVVHMNYMFSESKNLVIDIFNWNTSSVQEMSGLLYKTSNIYLLGDLTVPNNCDITNLLAESRNITYSLLIKGVYVDNDPYVTFDTTSSNGLLMYENETGMNTINNRVNGPGNDAVEYKPLHRIGGNPTNILVNDSSLQYFVARTGDIVKVGSGEGYIIKSISIKEDTSDNDVDFNYDNDTFTMPNDDVTINVTYIEKPVPAKVQLNKPTLIDYNNINISWTAASNVTGYGVVVSNGSSNIVNTTTTNLSYRINDLEENYPSYTITIYSYIDVDVDGHNKRFTSTESRTSSLKTSKELAAPTVTAKNIDFGRVLLSWNAIDDAAGYNLYYKKTSETNYKFYHETQDLSYELELNQNESYDFKVVAVTHFISYSSENHELTGYDSEYAFESKLFGTTSITTEVKPTVGSTIVESLGVGSMKVSWVGNESADFYKIYSKESASNEYEYLGQVTNKQYEFIDLLPGHKYNVKIVPYLVFNEAEHEGTQSTLDIVASGYNIGLASISGIVNKTYTGKGLTQNVKLVYEGKTLVKGTDYTVSYKNNIKVGTATVTITGIGDYYGSHVSLEFKINKANNPLAVTTKTKSVRYTKVKKKKQVVAPITVTKKQGTVTFVKQKGSSTKLSINKTTGKITVKKGTKKGTYKIKVKINASGNANYKAKYLIKTIKVRVK